MYLCLGRFGRGSLTYCYHWLGAICVCYIIVNVILEILMTKINLYLMPQECGQTFVYNYCECALELTLEKRLKKNEVCFINLYNSQLMLLESINSEDSFLEKSGKTIKIYFASKHIWLPGKYFLLFRDSQDKVFRYDLLLDEKGVFHSEDPFFCPKMSDEDMLSVRLPSHRNSWSKLSNMPGTMQLKRWAIERVKQNELNKLRKNMRKEQLQLCNYLLISAKVPCDIGISVILLKSVCGVESELRFGNLRKFYDMTKNNPYEAMNEFFAEAESNKGIFAMIDAETKPNTFVYSDLDFLMETGGKTILKAIQTHWPNDNGSVIFYGTQQEIDSLLEQNPSLKTYFPEENKLSFEPYTREEMIHFLFAKAEHSNLTLSAEAVDKVCHLMTKAYEQGSIVHWDKRIINEYIEKNLMQKYLQHAIEGISKADSQEELMEVQPSDIDDDFFLHQHSAYNDALEELQKMVGLTEIKRNIRILSGQMKFFQERRLLGLHTSNNATYHTLLTGNPGTGKTTVAKLLGKIYHSLGLLSKGEVVYADRSTIVGRYIGETEENMKLLLKEAKGNVLFIDEAYTLYSPDDSRDFGKHAVECLLDVLSRKDPDMLVIFAGYKKEMDTLLSMNPGLAGRFPNKFHFPNYTAEELMQIAEKVLSKDQYELTVEASSLLLQSIREAICNHSETFSNARWIEQFIKNGIIPALAERVTCSPHPFSKVVFQRIEASDVQIAAEKFNPKNVELKRRPAIGFCA